MSQALKESIGKQRETLYQMLLDPIGRLSEQAAQVWPQQAEIDELLIAVIKAIPWSRFTYAMNPEGVQISCTASITGLNDKELQRDRSQRPYMTKAIPESGLLLSDAYLSLRENRPSLTAVHRVLDDQGKLLGYIGVDFDLRDLPLTRQLYDEPGEWQQLKGDPAIRGGLFSQTRFESQLDREIDSILPVVEELMLEHGIFHAKIHFSSSRLTIWHISDPYRYRLLSCEDMIAPDTCLAYPKHAYPDNAVVSAKQIHEVMMTFRHLRFMDDTIYLRAGSLNIFNGIVGLNFSCDGSHYIPIKDFLARDSAFWHGLGETANNEL